MVSGVFGAREDIFNAHSRHTQEGCGLLEWVGSLLGTAQCLILGEVTSAWSERWTFQEEENVDVF